jgi:hypothetical protein
VHKSVKVTLKVSSFNAYKGFFAFLRTVPALNRYIKEFAEEIKALKAANAIILYFNDTTLSRMLNVDHHIAYTRVDDYYEWQEVKD